MKRVSEKNNFLYLTIGIVLLLFVGAISDQFYELAGQHLVQSFSVVTIIIGIYGFRLTQKWLHTGIGIAVSVVVVVSIGITLELLHLYYLHLILLFCFYLWAIWLAGRQVLLAGVTDTNRIVGAICIYLLTGLLWALMYLLIAQAIPGAFNGIEQSVWYENLCR